MYHLATVVPSVKRVRIPLSRDQIMLLLAAINEIFLGIDIYLAHDISGTIVPNEWIPIIFGPVAGAILLVAGLIALRQRPLATLIATAVFLGPLMFCLVGLFGLSAAWVEEPPDSGRLWMPGGWHVPMPLSKTRAYFLMFSLGNLITTISAVLDHARTGFDNRYLWIPVVVGVYATLVSALLGAVDRPNRGDLTIYVTAMLLMILTGLIGLALHVDDNLTSRGQFVLERFIRGAPFLAPLLFANMGVVGLVALLDPRSETLPDDAE
jgi:hypothetical protein